jgi:hypothetical protein
MIAKNSRRTMNQAAATGKKAQAHNRHLVENYMGRFDSNTSS